MKNHRGFHRSSRPPTRQSLTHPTPTRGFTLIELLIVVAIIAILAAIAVPNLLEAQTRSKVARVKADMRTYATALEAYATDDGEYPPLLRGNLTNLDITPLEQMLIPLSTPVSYLSSALLVEPFNAKQGWIMYRGWDVLAEGGPPPDAGQRQPLYTFVTLPNDDVSRFGLILLRAIMPTEYQNISDQELLDIQRRRWFLLSPGPDTRYAFDQALRDDPANIIGAVAAQLAEATIPRYDGAYDPTNGTTSHGDIVRTAAGMFNTPR